MRSIYLHPLRQQVQVRGFTASPAQQMQDRDRSDTTSIWPRQYTALDLEGHVIKDMNAQQSLLATLPPAPNHGEALRRLPQQRSPLCYNDLQANSMCFQRAVGRSK